MRRNWTRRWLVAGAVWLASVSSSFAQGFCGTGGCSTGGCSTGCSTGLSFGGFGTCCNSHHCPPPLGHCMEGAPKIRVRVGCPKPICNPCAQPGWGYYEACWNPWPFPPDYRHCPTTPPAALVQLSGHVPDAYPFYQGSPYGPQGQPAHTAPRTGVPPITNQPGMPPVRSAPMPAPAPVQPMPVNTGAPPMNPMAPMNPGVTSIPFNPTPLPSIPPQGNPLDSIPRPAPNYNY